MHTHHEKSGVQSTVVAEPSMCMIFLDRYKLQRDSIHVHVFKSNVIVAFTFKLAADHSRHLMAQLSLGKKYSEFLYFITFQSIYDYNRHGKWYTDLYMIFNTNYH